MSRFIIRIVCGRIIQIIQKYNGWANRLFRNPSAKVQNRSGEWSYAGYAGLRGACDVCDAFFYNFIIFLIFIKVFLKKRHLHHVYPSAISVKPKITPRNTSPIYHNASHILLKNVNNKCYVNLIPVYCNCNCKLHML